MGGFDEATVISVREPVRRREGGPPLSTAPATTRAISIRSGELRYDIIAPTDLLVGEAITGIGVVLTPSTRLIQERAGTPVEPTDSVLTLRDGDTISLIGPRPTGRQARRAATTARRAEGEPVAAWWLIGTIGVIAALAFSIAPQTLPHGWRWAVIVGLIVFALVATVVLITRRRAETSTTVGAAVLAPTSLLAAAAVAISPPSTLGVPVTLVTVSAVAASFLALCSVIARGGIARVQLSTLAVIATVVGAVHAAIVLLDAPEATAAAILVGAVPMALRALPSTLVEVPTGMFIDIERHQQTAWTVRQQLPEAITTVDRTRVARLIARSQARLLTATSALVAIAVVFLPAVIGSLAEVGMTARVGQLALMFFLVMALALSTRHHSARRLRMIVGGGAVACALICAVALHSLFSASLSTYVAAGALLAAVLASVAIVPVSRGARSLWWSRFGDIVETTCVIFSLPAALIAAGTIDAIRGWMN